MDSRIALERLVLSDLLHALLGFVVLTLNTGISRIASSPWQMLEKCLYLGCSLYNQRRHENGQDAGHQIWCVRVCPARFTDYEAWVFWYDDAWREFNAAENLRKAGANFRRCQSTLSRASPTPNSRRGLTT